MDDSIRRIAMSFARVIQRAAFLLCAITEGSADAALPAKWHPGHYVLVGAGPIPDEIIRLPRFRGVQRMYHWAKLEPELGQYDFTSIRTDLERLGRHGKQLVVQIQYKAFGKDSRVVPAYLAGPGYGGGVYRANSGSWNPVIWNRGVGERMAALFDALGREFDRHPGIEAVVLPETAPSVQRLPQPGVEEYTQARYVDSLKQHMLSLREAFPNTAVIQYTNFPPAILPELTEYMKRIGVGLGGPDVYPRESDLKDPVKGVYRLYAGLAGVVPLGAAVQTPDYSVANWRRTASFNKGADAKSAVVPPEDEVPIPVREHLSLARDTLKLNYLFWSASPRHFLTNVEALLASDDLKDDPAGGLHTAPPVRLQASGIEENNLP